MAKVTLKGQAINTKGELPELKQVAPSLKLTKTDLSEISMEQLKGKKIILNIFPSIDTPTCAMSVRKFNEAASKLNNTIVLCVSADLPFAQKRFCGAENIQNVEPVSVFRHPEFGTAYGLTIIEGPLTGLLARAVVIINEEGKISYKQLVSEITNEPNYDEALAAIEK